jgi:hypothetical protein
MRHGDSFLIREIHPQRLFVGNAMDARDLRLLHDHRIAAVVDLAGNEPPAQLTRDMIYCRIPIVDGDGNSNATIETEAFSVIIASVAILVAAPAAAADLTFKKAAS